MENCYCKEKCFYYTLTTYNKNSNYLEYRIINKCNRTIETEKKKKCKYLTNKLIKTIEYKDESIQKENFENQGQILTYSMVYNELDHLLNMSKPNIFLINRNLNILNLKSWNRSLESFYELKVRLSKPQIKESNFIYYNEANMPKVNKSIYNFEWTNDDFIKKILKIKTKKIKGVNKKKTSEHIEEIDLIDRDFNSDEDKSDDDDDDDNKSENDNKSEDGDDLNDFDNEDNENNVEDDNEEFSD